MINIFDHINFKRARAIVALAFCVLPSLYAQDFLPVAMVNSAYDEHHPVVSSGGEMHFTRAFHPKNTSGRDDPGDIWVAEVSAFGEFLEPNVVESLSTSGYDLFIGFLNSTTALVYHGDLDSKQSIYEYTWTGNDWERIKEVEIAGFQVKGDHFSARLNAEGNILILSMDSFGSYGNEDIYICEKNSDGSWSRPRNLGPQINSRHQELSPFLGKDDRILYFSSNGHGAEGGKNIFFSRRKGDSWTEWEVPQPINNLNSSGMELYYVEDINSGKAFFTSTQNSEGYGDILMVNQPVLSEIKKKDNETVSLPIFQEETPREEDGKEAPEMEIHGSDPENGMVETVGVEHPEQFRVVDKKSLQPLDYTWIVIDANGEPSPFEEDFHTLKKLVESGEQFEEITVISSGYLPYSLDPENEDTWPLEVRLTLMEEGANLSLDLINFKRSSAELEEGRSYRYIVRMASYLNEHPNVKILLEGHTDSFGSVRLNKELSLNRAITVRNIMVENGIAFERIRVNGWGGTKPIASNQTAEGRAQNRRVEMVILEK